MHAWHPPVLFYIAFGLAFIVGCPLLLSRQQNVVEVTHYAPGGGHDPKGEVVDTDLSMGTVAHITRYDSLLVDSHQFESLWPRTEKAEDNERRKFLKEARRRKLDPNAIKMLSDPCTSSNVGPTEKCLAVSISAFKRPAKRGEDLRASPRSIRAKGMRVCLIASCELWSGEGQKQKIKH
jgi:hypothetical protein